jgi:hypothetical protein
MTAAINRECSMDNELVAADVDVKFEGGKVKVSVNHVGKHGGAKLEAYAEAKPFLDKAIDEIEKLVPGDQKIMAATLKAAIANLSF